MAGWLQTRDMKIESYKDRLDALAENLIAEVNDTHTAGFDLIGLPEIDFFEGSGPEFAAHMAVNRPFSMTPT